jgi:hypothetical protein
VQITPIRISGSLQLSAKKDTIEVDKT